MKQDKQFMAKIIQEKTQETKRKIFLVVYLSEGSMFRPSTKF
jgi:hypothetical protein